VEGGPEERMSGGFLRNVLPALLWTLALFIGGGGPPPPQGADGLMGIPYDKLMHVVAFGFLQWLVFRALRYELPKAPRLKLALAATALAAAIGVFLEVYQMALPDRSADAGDALADAIGAVIGIVSNVRWRRGRTPS
jgi:VanZ family protein